jgi:3-dehydroquinate synthase
MANLFEDYFNIEIKSAALNYKIHFLSSFSKNIYNEDLFIIYDEILADSLPYEWRNSEQSFALKCDEFAKDFYSLNKVLQVMADVGVNRKTQVLAIGGGIVQDVATFCCSIYMRGLAWDYYPSTMMSMTDSCIGGKSSINLGIYKNLLGNFHPPTNIFIIIELTESLEETKIADGIAEALKISYVAGLENFIEFTTLLNIWKETKSKKNLIRVIHSSLESKRSIIEEDEFDLGKRQLLNFGHSYGHALESASNFSISHGYAVLVGMLAAINRSAPSKRALDLHSELLRLNQVYINAQMSPLKFNLDVFKNQMAKDKKNQKNLQRLILLDSNGSPTLRDFPLTSLQLEECSNDLINALNQCELTYEIL